VILFIILFILKNPKFASEAIYTSIVYCVKIIVPSLFPFMVLTNLLMESDFVNIVSRLLRKPVEILFNVNGNCSTAILLGCIAGFPVGAKCSAMLYNKGMCSKSEAEKILPYCNNAGPAFVIGTIGIGVFGDYRTGVILYVVQIISAVICGVILSFPRGKISANAAYNDTAPTTLSAAIVNAGTSMISVCGHICFFSLLLNIIVKYITNPYLITFVCGFIEITSGVKLSGNIAVAGLFCGWSGLAVLMQISLFVTQHGISMKYCVIGKLLQGIIMFFILLFIKKYGNYFYFVV